MILSEDISISYIWALHEVEYLRIICDFLKCSNSSRSKVTVFLPTSIKVWFKPLDRFQELCTLSVISLNLTFRYWDGESAAVLPGQFAIRRNRFLKKRFRRNINYSFRNARIVILNLTSFILIQNWNLFFRFSEFCAHTILDRPGSQFRHFAEFNMTMDSFGI